MAYTNSSLVTYTKLSPNRTSPRKHKIDTITIHCYVGQVTAKSGCNARRFVNHNPISGASCNYVVGYDGSIGLCVEECNRSWCSSNKKNDHRAITIEVASDTKAPYTVTNAAMNSLIKLCADICQRNNIEKLVWSTNKKERVNHLNGCNMTVHRDFAAKSCPGDYLYGKHKYIADEVNKLINTKSVTISVGGYIFNGIDYSPVFNPKYYANRYSDLRTEFGFNHTKLFEHFCQYGMKEARQAIETFNVTIYKNRYEDLRKAFGNNLPDYYKHWIQFGKKEGRSAV